ncbi:hypothetical protein H4S07_004800, partial [Coemansia furcata]
MDPIERVSSLKVPVSRLGWKASHKPTLDALVLLVHKLTVHSGQLARFIFINETARDPSFNPGFCLDQAFFYRVFMSFCQRQYVTATVPTGPWIPNDFLDSSDLIDLAELLESDTPDDVVDFMESPELVRLAEMLESADLVHPALTATVQRNQFFDELIASHFDEYCAAADMAMGRYGSMSRIGNYVSTQPLNDYTVNIKQRFGHFRIDERRRDLEREMAGQDIDAIRAAREQRLWAPARAVRRAIESRPISLDGLDADGVHVVNALMPVLTSYGDDYEFANNNIYYDAKANPAQHFLAFIRLCRYFEEVGIADQEAAAVAAAEAAAVAAARTAYEQVAAEAERVAAADIMARARALNAAEARAIADSRRQCKNKAKNRRRRRRRANARRLARIRAEGIIQGQENNVDWYRNMPPTAKVFQCCPIRSTFVPGHMHIDPPILYSHFLKNIPGCNSASNMRLLWGKVVNLKAKAFHDREGLTFCGSVDTDGVSITLIFKHPDALKRGCMKRFAKVSVEDSATDCSTPDCPYIDTIPRDQLASMKERLVFNDMGYGDLLHLMAWGSTADNPVILRYTRCQRLVEMRMRHFAKLRELAKLQHPDSVLIREAENYLSHFNRTSLNPVVYRDYIVAHANVWTVLTDFYSHTLTKHVGSSHPLSMPGNRLATKHVARNVPFHRKLKSSAYINQQQADHRLERNIRSTFTKDPVFAFGDWSASMKRHHAPVRGKGWRKKFKKFGFPVYLINEYRTSKVCPECTSDLENFKEIRNPRPYRRHQRPRIICHGLLRCQNRECKWAVDDNYKVVSYPGVFNRDTAAVLNFREIVDSLLKTGERPVQLP